MDQNRIKQIKDKTDIRSFLSGTGSRKRTIKSTYLGRQRVFIETDFLPDYTREYGLQLRRKLCRFQVKKEFVFL